MRVPLSPEGFIPPDRFRVERQLGAGGMGAVYQVYDRERDEIVALKRLVASDPSATYRFKREFRALADLVHPNLVNLYELVVQENQCFFTMELVDGLSLLQHVRPGKTSSGQGEHEGLDHQRLGSALKQLAEGVATLHEAGIVHRDLKPSNVLVTPEGRLVILDFGLATEYSPTETLATVAFGLAGTLPYLAPELFEGATATPASDWYSLGVILYEALAGRPLFQGNVYQMMMAKQSRDVIDVNAAAPNAPAFLVDLCRALLARDPAKRPAAAAILKLLGASAHPAATDGMASRHRSAFIGRESHLSALERAFETVARGEPATVYVYGPSGVGKSSLVDHFLDQLRWKTRSLTLLGRCYEREWIPFKALDGVVDNLAKHLMYLPRDDADGLMPRNIHALARVFPVLLQVESVSQARRPDEEIPDALSLRRQAFSTLRELLILLSRRYSLIVYIDDFHWADPDSTALIEDLLRPPDAPPLLLLASFRSEEIEAKPFLQNLLRDARKDNCVALAVNPLSDDEVRTLISSLLTKEHLLREKVIGSIVKEAAGNPFLVEQLVRHALESGEGEAGQITLAEMLDARLRRLPPGAKELMQVVTVSGKPVDFKVASEAAGVNAEERRLVAALRAAHLLRGSVSAQFIESYHDRIRETLAAGLAGDVVRQIHARLARTLLNHGFDDPETLLEHYMAAGEQQLAADKAVLAAQKASAALAFDRAALYYRRAIELGHPTDYALIDLKISLAAAIVNAGRPIEAADIYLDIADRLPTARALEYRQRAAAQFFAGGYIDRGTRVVRDVLAAVGLKFPSSPRIALASLLLHRAWLRLRGLNFVQRSPSQISERDLLRIDACWSVATGLAVVDHIRGSDFMLRHLLFALRAGDPYRIARGLTLEASLRAGVARTDRNPQELQTRAIKLAEVIDEPVLNGLIDHTRGCLMYYRSEWKKALELFQRAEETFRDRCTGAHWELSAAQFLQAGCLQHLGELNTMFHRRLAFLATARERGNLLVETHFRIRLSIVWLAEDDPARAEKEVLDAIEHWSQKGFHLQHMLALVGLTQVELYLGRGKEAWNRLQRQWPTLQGSLLMRVKVLHVEAEYLRARCALAASEDAEDPRYFLSVAAHHARRLETEKGPWAASLSLLTRAAMTARDGDRRQASSLLARAAEGLESIDMALYAAAARRRQGQVLGPEGSHLIAQSGEWMNHQRIVKPDAITRMLIPGFKFGDEIRG